MNILFFLYKRKINHKNNLSINKKKLPLPIITPRVQHMESKPKTRKTKTKQREVQRIIKTYNEKLEKLNVFKHQIKSIIAVKRVTKAPALKEVPKTPQMIDMKEAAHNTKRQNQIQKLNPDFRDLKKKKDAKPDTLRRLFDIAGEDWTIDVDNTGAKTTQTFSCPAEDGYFPSAYSCSVYYRCVHGQKTKLECSSGLSWSVDKGGCDWEGLVIC